MSFDNWDEIRTAYQVARLGTVSGAADVLGVHHATVIRHIDALERRLGTKLFQRHARGYTATEAGRDLQIVAQTTEDQFSQLVGRIKGQGETVTGELIVTSIGGLTDPVHAGLRLVPAGTSGRSAAVPCRLRGCSGWNMARRMWRSAPVPCRRKPDNVVQPLTRIRWGLFASTGYAAEQGLPETTAELAGHHFIGSEFGSGARAVPPLAGRAGSGRELYLPRVRHGSDQHGDPRCRRGSASCPSPRARATRSWSRCMPTLPEWEVPLWLVTHVDLHRTTKVQAFLQHIKEASKQWDAC